MDAIVLKVANKVVGLTSTTFLSHAMLNNSGLCCIATLNADSKAYDIDASAEPSNKYDIIDAASTAGNFKVLLTAADAVGSMHPKKGSTNQCW